MTATTKLMPYPEERALEHAAWVHGATPTRIYSVLLPIWCVEVSAQITEGEPYELIDRHLERGIAEAGLDTVADLASFFVLDPALIRQVLRFLTAIGHVAQVRDRLVLTALGHRSLQDNKRYVVTREDRRKLYFDALTSSPLTRPYYDVRKVTFLSEEAAREALQRRGAPRLHIFSPAGSFPHTALTALANNSDRDRFNLPERIDDPTVLDAPSRVFVPAYVVRAVGADREPQCLVYTPVADEADEDLTAACSATPEVTSALEAEEVDAERQDFQDRAGRWLSTRNMARYQPTRHNGLWRVTLPGQAFTADGGLPLTKLGSFVVLNTSFFHIWCSDKELRRRALVERIDLYLLSRSSFDRNTVEQLIARIGRQLGVAGADIASVRRLADQMGKKSVANHLGRLL